MRTSRDPACHGGKADNEERKRRRFRNGFDSDVREQLSVVLTEETAAQAREIRWRQCPKRKDSPMNSGVWFHPNVSTIGSTIPPPNARNADCGRPGVKIGAQAGPALDSSSQRSHLRTHRASLASGPLHTKPIPRTETRLRELSSAVVSGGRADGATAALDPRNNAIVTRPVGRSFDHRLANQSPHMVVATTNGARRDGTATT